MRSSYGDEIECILSHEADKIEIQNLKMLNPQQQSQLTAEFVPFSSDKRCLYVTSGSLRSLYSTQELAGISVAVLNFLQRK
ncbi:hypothetical protein Bca4012_059059 [Brassica carinata]